MEPYSSPSASSVFLPEASSASSSSPSSQNQLQSRTIVQHRVTTAEATSSTTGISTLPLSHVYRPTNHHHHRHHNDHNHDNTANSSGSSSNSSNINININININNLNNFNTDLRNIHSVPMPQVTRVSSTTWQAQESNLAPPHEQNQTFDPSPQEYDEDEPLEGDEDRQSDEGSDGEPGHHDMEFWLQRCSICFDARLDFCLEFCRDQFCRNCFQRYVKEVVSNSWGLDVTKIKCPVCQDAISVSEWTKYVDQSTLAQYHQYNQPYRSFSRFCNECDHELVVSKVNRAAIGLPASSLLPLFDNVLADLKTLLTRAGLNVDDPAEIQPSSSISTNAPREQRSRTLKRQREPSSRDETARKIVQRFTEDYRSYCGVLQGAQQSLPSRAQTYLSNLASRALGVSFTQSAPPSSTNIAPLKPPQSQQTESTPSLSSLEAQLIQASQSNWPTAPGLIHQIIDTSHQRKQHCPRANGVLDIYKPLVTSLLDLFELRETQYGSRQLDQDQSSANQDDSLEISDATNHQDLAIEAGDANSGPGSSGTQWKESMCTTTSRQSIKATQTARQRIVTRAESRRQTEIKRSLVQLSKQLSSLETRPEQWKELQFLHVRWLRWDLCNNCGQDLCLQCGESSHHDTKSCFGYMRSLISRNSGTKDLQKKRSGNTGSRHRSTTSLHAKSNPKGKKLMDQDTSTIQWKLANTNPCPNCCILIHRDDGCNKVDCMLCGHRFCWICREAWGAACGFFKCGKQPVEDVALRFGIDEDSESMDEDVVTGEGQVRSLAVSDGVSEEIEQDQASPEISRQDRRRRRSEDLSKPEIGVPNVFVIHTKRSRA